MPALAADIALKAPCCSTPVWSWTGFYVGGNLGYSWGHSSETDTVNMGLGPYVTSQSFNVNGVIGGGQVGANWQTGIWVLGLEADLDASGQRGSGTSTTCTFAAAACDGSPLSAAVTERLDWLNTDRVRVGVAVNNNSWLLYGTGGLAVGRLAYSSTTTAVGSVLGPFSASESQTRSGWTVGGGAEFHLSGNWTGRVEYLYVDLGNLNSLVVPLFVGTSDTITFGRFTDNIVRAGLNYRFNWDPAPAPCCVTK